MEEARKQRYFSKEEALIKARKYCAYQERSHQEVRTKLLNLGQRGAELEQIISKLIEENFLNEERFAIAFTLGKFRIKKWGKVKIERELKFRKVSNYCIAKAIGAIEQNDYEKTLKSVLLKKWNAVKAENNFVRKNKTAQYLMSRGFESEMIWIELNAQNEN